MHGVRSSRWSMKYFAVAMASLGLAELLWASGLAQPLGNIGSAWVLVGVHLTTIGFLTLVMMGALHQFVPVLTETELASQTWSGVTFWSVTVGLLGMVSGFLALPGAVPGGILPQVPWLLPVGGSLVIAGVVVAAINLGTTLKRAWPWTLPTWFVATSFVFLVITVFAGLLLALSLAIPGLFTSGQLQVMGGRGLAAHVIGGVGGWLTLTAMGVSYKLLAMFTLSDERRGAWGWAAYLFTTFGIAAAWLARWIGVNGLADLGWAAILIGLAVYLWDMAALYRQRKRRKLELNARYALVPLGFLGVLILAAAVVRIGGVLTRLDIALAFLALYGWLGGLALTQLYKIIPFLTWLNQFGSRLGKGRTPRVQDLVSEARDRYAYALYFAAIAVGTVCLGLGSSAGFRVAMLAAFAATADIARALYHGSHPEREESGFGTSAVPFHKAR